MKYVRFKHIGFVLSPEFPLTDGEYLAPAHKRVALLAHDEVISAGFVRFTSGAPVCHGRSDSIGIGGLPDDAKALAEQLGLPR